MKFGCSISLEQAFIAETTGFDYLELPVRNLMPESKEKDFNSVFQKISSLKITPEVLNLFIPSDLKIVGNDVDEIRLAHYIENTMCRASAVGGKIIVFGSGGARRVPENFSRQVAWNQLKLFLNKVGQIACHYGIIIAVEPLNSHECNILNSVKEVLELIEEVGRPEIKLMIDLYHLQQEGENLSPTPYLKDNLVHVHVADSGRSYPGSGSYDYDSFFQFLKTLPYEQRISVECHWNNLEQEASRTLIFLKKKWYGEGQDEGKSESGGRLRK